MRSRSIELVQMMSEAKFAESCTSQPDSAFWERAPPSRDKRIIRRQNAGQVASRGICREPTTVHRRIHYTICQSNHNCVRDKSNSDSDNDKCKLRIILVVHSDSDCGSTRYLTILCLVEEAFEIETNGQARARHEELAVK
jgi:hypothetical protein